MDEWFEAEGRRLRAADILEIDLSGFPPVLRVGDDLLFVDAPRKAELAAFAAKHGIPLRERFDVWGALLEPALDTQFSPEHRRRTIEALLEQGFTEEEVEAIRARVVEPMRRWNLDSMTWDWVHLGLWDLRRVLGESWRAEATAIALRAYR